MARLFNGTNDSIEAASAPVTAVPLTIAAWVRPNASASGMIVCLNVLNGVSRFGLNVNQSTGTINADSINSVGTIGSSTSSGTITAGEWAHAAGVFSTTANRVAYLNGVAGTANTTNVTPNGLNRVNIGSRFNTTRGFYLAGGVAEVAIWNAALTSDEIASLANGFNPRLIRPSAIRFLSRLIRNVQDLSGGITLSEMGTGTTVSDHPRIIYP